MATGLAFLGYTDTAPTIPPVFVTDISVETTGEVTMPRQPAFFAYLAANVANATGDGTLVSPSPLGSTIFNVGSYFATDTFTAPISGKYEFIAQVRATVAVAMTTILTNIVTSNRSILIQATTGALREVGGSAARLGNGAVLVDMDAGDTAILSYLVNGSTKTATILGSAAAGQTFLMGKLIC